MLTRPLPKRSKRPPVQGAPTSQRQTRPTTHDHSEVTQGIGDLLGHDDLHQPELSIFFVDKIKNTITAESSWHADRASLIRSVPRPRPERSRTRSPILRRPTRSLPNQLGTPFAKTDRPASTSHMGGVVAARVENLSTCGRAQFRTEPGFAHPGRAQKGTGGLFSSPPCLGIHAPVTASRPASSWGGRQHRASSNHHGPRVRHHDRALQPPFAVHGGPRELSAISVDLSSATGRSSGGAFGCGSGVRRKSARGQLGSGRVTTGISRTVQPRSRERRRRGFPGTSSQPRTRGGSDHLTCRYSAASSPTGRCKPSWRATGRSTTRSRFGLPGRSKPECRGSPWR